MPDETSDSHAEETLGHDDNVDPQVNREEETHGSPEETEIVNRAARPRFDQRVPERFGRYRITRKLGQGAMGAVYLGKDETLDRWVALKVPFFERSDSADIIERFYREARAMATLRHPHLCPVYDVGEIDGLHYLSMAFIDGNPLDEVLSQQKLSDSQVVVLVRKLATALQYAHEAGIVHRDLKPANIMIDERDEPLIMDFGLARRAQQGELQLTQSGAILGSPAYMSPEQVEADQQRIGPATDVYSLGVIMYRMLTGALPFEGSVGSVMAKILTEAPKAPAQMRPNIEPALQRICLKAMAKKLEDRYPSADELAQDLTRYLQGETYVAEKTMDMSGQRQQASQAAKPPRHETASGSQSSTKKRLAVFASTAVVFLIVATVFMLNRGRSTSPSPESTGAAASVLADGGSAPHQDTGSAKPRQRTTFGPRMVAARVEEVGFCCAADFNGDGHVDLASSSWDASQISWHENDGSGQFTTHVLSAKAYYAISVVAVDLDKDADSDLLAAIYGTNVVSWFENDGKGRFVEHLISDLVDGARFAVADDLDGDGDLDVVAAGGRDSKLTWHENDGNQVFTEHFIAEVDSPKDIAIVDLTGDKRPDIVCSCSSEHAVRWFQNDPRQAFLRRTITDNAEEARGVFATDMDGDGDVDVLSSAEGNNLIAWHENDGHGQFTSHVISTAAYSARDVHAADLDRDGDLDVVSASFADDTVAWYENDGSQNFERRVISTDSDGAYCVFTADIDGDNMLDVVVASSSDHTLGWFKNSRLP